MIERVGVSRRSLLAGGAALGLGAMMGPGAFAQAGLSSPYSNKSLDYYFFVIQEEAVKRAVAAASGKFQATNANFDNTRQLEQWQSLLLSQPSALISDPIDSQAIVSAIRRYNQKGIPVGIIDTPADGGDVEITYLARPTEGQLEQMLAVTLSTLSEYPDLDAVHAPSDSPSRGIVTALQQKDRWKKVGEEGHVIFVNIDGEPVALKWIQEGYMDACVSQDPIAYGEIAVELIVKHALKGEAVPLGTYENKKYFWEKGEIVAGNTGPTLIIPAFVINGDNAADARHWGAVAEKEWGIPYS